MFSFGNLSVFGGWREASRSSLSKEDIATIKEAKVDAFADGALYVKFFLVSGGYRSITLSRESKLRLGDAVDPSKGVVITFTKQGENDAYRWEETA